MRAMVVHKAGGPLQALPVRKSSGGLSPHDERQGALPPRSQDGRL